MSDRAKPDNNDEDFSFADAMQGVTRHSHDKADLKPARRKDINLTRETCRRDRRRGEGNRQPLQRSC